MSSLESKLKEIKRQIDETEFNLRICDSHIQFMHEMTDSGQNSYTKKDYEIQMGQDAYKRMHLQNKLRALMNKCMEIEDKLLEY